MATLDHHNLGTHENIIEEKLIEMAEFVNDNGGWTVMGWHRRGTTNMGPNNVPVVTLQTLGHLMRIFPTSLADRAFHNHWGSGFVPLDVRTSVHETQTHLGLPLTQW